MRVLAVGAVTKPLQLGVRRAIANRERRMGLVAVMVGDRYVVLLPASVE